MSVGESGQRTTLRAAVKRAVLPSGSAVRTIRGGIARGLRMEIDFETQTRLYLNLLTQPWVVSASW